MTQPVTPRRARLDAETDRMHGRRVPDRGTVDPHLDALLDECQLLLEIEPNIMRVVHKETSLADAMFDSTNNEYWIEINPGYGGVKEGVDQDLWITAALLHEIMHVRCGRMYQQPHDQGTTGMFNFHLPANQGDQAIGDSLNAQDAVARKNYTKLDGILDTDSKLTTSQRTHLKGRIEYAEAMPEVHYDTVLLDMLVVITMGGWAQAKGYERIRQMSQEALARRKAAPAPLTKTF